MKEDKERRGGKIKKGRKMKKDKGWGKERR